MQGNPSPHHVITTFVMFLLVLKTSGVIISKIWISTRSTGNAASKSKLKKGIFS